jgi:hypothetical protein
MEQITEQQALIKNINQGIIDVNLIDSFFSNVIKGYLFKLNNALVLRNEFIPHIILNTGDDIMYLENKGYNYNEGVSNEDFIYNNIPRCIVQVNGITIQTDQLTKWSDGTFQIDNNGTLYGIVGSFRRFPIKIGTSLKYYFDSFNDALITAQQIISKEAFVNNFEIGYLGQRIFCSYSIPESEEIEKIIEFDGLTMESKNKTISLDIEIETNLPVVDNSTVVLSDSYIKEQILSINTLSSNGII